MNIKGIHKTSFIDFPGKISVVLFTGGCNLGCGYCHNPGLATDDNSLEVIKEDDVLSFLSRRKGLVDGVTLSGGEPTLQGDLLSFIKKIRELELAVKLDTNGLRPAVVEELLRLELLDYVALDIKTSPEKYDELTRRTVDFSSILRTLDLLRKTGIDYEVRTTCIPGYAGEEDFLSIGRTIGRVKRYALQQFISSEALLDSRMEGISPYPARHLENMKKIVLTFADSCVIRGI